MSDAEGEAVHVTTDEFAAYVDGTVSTDERVRIDGHLASCLSCAKELLALSRLTKRSAMRRYIKVVLPAAAAAAVALLLQSGPQAEIVDAVHGTMGNAHFFLLPPMVADPMATGVFDGSLAPEVAICEWTGSECLSPLFAELTCVPPPYPSVA